MQDEIKVLYMSIYSAKKYIDYKYYNLIDEFKNNFFINIISAPLFGICILKNSDVIRDQVTFLADQFKDKIEELENYVYKV